MSKLGLILACDHYPAVSDRAGELDAQFRHWLLAVGFDVQQLTLWSACDGDVPHEVTNADAWIVSGLPLPGTGGSAVRDGLERFLQEVVAEGRPLLAVNHGEHLVHDALATIGAKRPETAAHIRSIRNPFRSFLGRDTLHRFNPVSQTVEALARPAILCPRGLFGSARIAA